MSRLTALIVALAIGSLPMLACSGGSDAPAADAGVTYATVEASSTPAAGDTPLATPPPAGTPAVTAPDPPPPGAGPVTTFRPATGTPGADFVITTPGTGGQFQAGVGVPFTSSGPGGPGVAGAPQGVFVSGPAPPGLAQFLGISTEQLEADLKQPGATQATIAAKYGKSRDALKTFMLGQQRNSLDQAMRSGSMPKTLADQVLLQFTADIDKMIDGAPGAGPLIIGPGQPVPAPR